MEQEPVYNFVKGVGWVPSVTNQLTLEYQTKRLEKYRVTLIDRAPVIGEHFYTLGSVEFTEGEPLNLTNTWNIIKSDMEYRPQNMGGRIDNEHDLIYFSQMRNTRFVTIFVEPCA